MANTTYKEGKIIKWMEEDWTAGAFAWAYPGQIHAIEPALRESHMADMLRGAKSIRTCELGSQKIFELLWFHRKC